MSGNPIIGLRLDRELLAAVDTYTTATRTRQEVVRMMLREWLALSKCPTARREGVRLMAQELFILSAATGAPKAPKRKRKSSSSSSSSLDAWEDAMRSKAQEVEA